MERDLFRAGIRSPPECHAWQGCVSIGLGPWGAVHPNLHGEQYEMP